MAKEVQTEKRKASVPEGEAIKLKKVKIVETITTGVTAEPVKKRKATEDAAPVAIKKTKTPKSTSDVTHKAKLTKKETVVEAVENPNGDYESTKAAKNTVKELKPSKSVKTKNLKLAKPIESRSYEEESNGEVVEGQDDESEVDDQTEALLQGFESDGDDKDDQNEGGLKEGDAVPEAPISKRSKKQLQKVTDFPKNDKPGVVYVGRIPHGFYEHEMKEYFKQFGTILKLRMSRNRKSGSSRHVAWIEFESAAVGEIVAKTMDNYLLFGHILKVKVVPEAQVPAGLWKGANRRFKKVPWNKIEGRKLSLPKPEIAWDRQTEREQARRDMKADKLKAIGYEFESPKLKSAKGLGKKVEKPASITEKEVEPKTIEAAPTTTEEEVEARVIETGPSVLAYEDKKKEKKDNKREKNANVIEPSKTAVEVDAAPVAEGSSKPKKMKETKVVEIEDSSVVPDSIALQGSTETISKSKKVKTTLAEDASKMGKEKAGGKKIRKKGKVTE